MRPLRLSIAVTALVLATSPFARAQPSSPQDREAHALFEAATTAFDDGRFEDAHGYFARAHALSGRPELLFNLASVSERLRRDADALEFYRRYLAEIPEADNRRFVEGRIAFLERSLAPRAPTPTDDASPSEAAVAPPVPTHSSDIAHEESDAESQAVASRSAVAEPAEEDDPESPGDAPAREAPMHSARSSHRVRNVLLGVVAGVVSSGLGLGLGFGLRDPGYGPYTRGDFGAGGIVFTLVGP